MAGPGPARKPLNPGRRNAARFGWIFIVAIVAILAANAWPSVRGHFRGNQLWVDAPVAAGPAVIPRGAPAAYRVTYRVDAGNPVGRVVRTETLEIQRPWRSRLTTRVGAPPGGRVTDIQVSDFGKLDLRPVGEAESVLVVQPELAASDLRLDVDLPALQRVGAVAVRERRTVIDRPCQVYRTAAPPQGLTLTKLRRGGDDVVDSCVDADGLVLEQVQLFMGKLLLRRRAVHVDTRPGFEDHVFDIVTAPTVPTGMGGGAIAELDPATAGTAPGTSFVLDDAPEGFTRQGRYAVSPSAPPNSTGGPQGNRRGGFVDVWTSGVDTLMLDQGGLEYGGDPLGSLPLAVDVSAGPHGPARAVPGARLSQVVFRLQDGRYVRVMGTLPIDRLTAIAASLRRVEV